MVVIEWLFDGRMASVVSDYILVVDDDPDVRRLISDVLRLFGLRGQHAVNGAEALALVRQNPPRAIVLDVMMPVLDGLSLLALLQRSRAGHHIPIILLSGVGDEAQYLKQLPGVAAVMCKGDFSLDAFRATLRQAGITLN